MKSEAKQEESSGLRVHRELNDVCYVEFLRVLECFQKMMLALQARKVAEHRCRKACLRELRVVESFESWTMSGRLIS